MAESEFMYKVFVHFIKALREQDLPGTKEPRGRNSENHNTTYTQKKKPTAKCIKILIRYSDKHTAKSHMTVCIKCVSAWQTQASNVNITVLTRMDEVAGEMSLWPQLKELVKSGNALCQRNPPDWTKPWLCWHSWFQAQTPQHSARLQECSRPYWRNHNKCRKYISALWVPHRPQTLLSPASWNPHVWEQQTQQQREEDPHPDISVDPRRTCCMGQSGLLYYITGPDSYLETNIQVLQQCMTWKPVQDGDECHLHKIWCHL